MSNLKNKIEKLRKDINEHSKVLKDIVIYETNKNRKISKQNQTKKTMSNTSSMKEKN